MREVREVARETLYKGFQSVDRVTVQVEGEEKPLVREVVDRGDAVGVLIHHLERDEYLLVRQVRTAMVRHGEPWLLEIVAGMIDPGENPEQAAVREVEEEVGYQPQALKPLGSMYGSPGGLAERVWLYLAEVSEAERTGEGGGLEDEDIELVWLKPEEVRRMVAQDELRDAKSQIAILKSQGSRLEG